MVDNPDLLPVLALLGAEYKVDFTREVPNSWYYNGKNLVFCQKMKDGTGWNEAAIPAAELEKVMLNKDVAENNNKTINKFATKELTGESNDEKPRK